MASKMWNRYHARPQIYSAHEASERRGTEERYCLPGIQCYPFLSALQHAVSRKLLSGEILLNWIAPNSLYELWKITCGVSTELLADCFNESGVLNAYCSADAEDEQFGSMGTWESNEKEISAAGANPPFAPHTLQNVICMFEEGVQKSVPYCRCAVLPIGKRYDILSNFNSLTFEGLLLVMIPAGCFPFKNQRNLMSGDCVKEKPSMHQTLGLFVWCSREHLISFPIPIDVEESYEYWVSTYLEHSERVVIHRDSFSRAFPDELRSSARVIPGYPHSFLKAYSVF